MFSDAERLQHESLTKGAVWAAPEGAESNDPIGRLSLIEVTGVDRMDWLQGQVTNDLRGLTPGQQTEFCFLKPTGQIVADCRMWVFDERCLMETPRVCVPALLERFESLVIMEDVSARDLTDGFSLVSVLGPKSSAIIDTIGVESSEESLIVPCRHFAGEGFDIWSRAPSKILVALNKTPRIQAHVLNLAALEAGIPYYGIDMNEKTLLLEMGPAFEARTVSHTKGCYTGQEIVARIHSRGHTNRTWVALISKEPLFNGATVLSAEGNEIGSVTRTGFSPRFGNIAGAMLRNEAAITGFQLEVERGHMKVGAAVHPFPLA